MLSRAVAASQIRLLMGLTMVSVTTPASSVRAVAPGDVAFYVGPDGNDAWSGRLPEPNATKSDGPFATLERAREAVRTLRSRAPESRLRGGATVFVRGGTYEITRTFTLGPEDSGRPGAPIVYRAYKDEKPRLVGARKVTGFKPFKGRILRCDLRGTDLLGVRFRQLFFRGQRQVMARYPNKDPNDPHFGKWAHVAAVERGGVRRSRFTCTPDVIKNWTKLQYAEVCIHPGYDWAWNVIPIKAVDRDLAQITLARNTSYDIQVGDRYFVQNLLEELDAPDEWYLDCDTWTLYFWPAADLSKGDVRAPVVGTVVAVRGAHDVVLRGFTIEACDGDAVVIEDSERCVVAQSVVRNCGGWGVHIRGGHKSGAIGNDIYATGAGGILLGGGDRKTLQRGDNFAVNNYIHHVAEFRKTYHGGILIRGVGNVASHNLIHDCYHQGIGMGGNDNVVEYNIVHHTNLGSADSGALYMSSRDYTARGNVIRYNIFHHVGGFGKANSWRPVANGRVKFVYPHFTWAVYLDAPETGVHVYGNVFYSVPLCAMFNHSGKDNTWENNIVVDAPAFRASVWGRSELFKTSWSKVHKAQQAGIWPLYLKHYPELARYDENEPRPATMFNCKFVRNIVYYTREGSKWLREQKKSAWGGGQLLWTYRGHNDDFGEFEFDRNLVYAPPGIGLKVELTLLPGPRKLLNWDEWRKTGKDRHSIFADPLFVDPANRDFRLQPDSPALKLGFKPIPLDKIGPYKDELRASWPIVEAPGASALGDFTTTRYFQLPGYKPVPARVFVPRDGARNFFAKLAGNRAVTLACFAGGDHQQGGWLDAVVSRLHKRYPAAKINAIDASIPGCVRGASFSVYRFAHDVLRHKPDLVFVDFAADDNERSMEDIWRAVEGIVRQTWNADPTTDIVFVYAFRPEYEKAYDDGLCPDAVSAYERLADHYGIPSVNMGVRIAQMAREGRLVVHASTEEAKRHPGKIVFTHDGVYITPAARRLYGQFVAEGLMQLAESLERARPTALTPHPLKKPFRSDHLERASLWPIKREMLSGKWQKLSPKRIEQMDFSRHFDAVWFTNTPGSKLTFRFKGTEVGLFDLVGPDTGCVKVIVDGRDMGMRQRVDRWMYYQRLSALSLASGLDDTVHTVTIELLPDPPDRSVFIAEAKKLGRYDDPKRFEGVALRIGWIRVVGEVLE